MKTYLVKFFDLHGVCYFKKEACHVDISTYTTLIDFSTDGISSGANIFRSYDEMQDIKVLQNMIIINFISGQKIVIYLC